MKFSRIYNVRSSEITPEYKLKEFYIGMYFQECFAEYMASKGLAAYDLAKSGQTWLTSDVQIDYLQEMPFCALRQRLWNGRKKRGQREGKMFYNAQCVNQGI